MPEGHFTRLVERFTLPEGHFTRLVERFTLPETHFTSPEAHIFYQKNINFSSMLF
ncbi:MAG TPA: hypothetical protein PKY56_11465 [Candidatus Kapabacteria bacterium]|nr:hypothetical protein [Candidatus Kapabacteria bacterium]